MAERDTALTTEDWHVVVRTMAARVDELERRLREETKTSMAFCDESCEAEEELTKCQADLAAAQARIAELERQPAPQVTREDVREAAQAHRPEPISWASINAFAQAICDRLGLPADPTE